MTAANRKGRVKTTKYRNWITSAVPLVAQLQRVTSYPVRFFYHIRGTVNESRDGDNLQKPLLDLCKMCGVITDDSLKYVVGSAWEYTPGEGDGNVLIWFEENQP